MFSLDVAVPEPGSEAHLMTIIKPDDYHDWLGVRLIDEARSFVTLPDAQSMAAAPASKAAV